MALLANNTADEILSAIDNTSETIILYAEREELLVGQELALFFVALLDEYLSLSLSALPVYFPSRS